MIEQDVISTYFFNNTGQSGTADICDDFLTLVDELNVHLEHIKIPKKVQVVYNPTIYARHTFEMYVRNYCNTPKHIMFFGMNPGPWGMSQTGVPFGEIQSVRDWLRIKGPVGKPPTEIEPRPVMGFECTRAEISGQRFWGLFKSLCGTPENFFESSFVYNYLPQQWMTNTGCNVTPDDFKISEVEELYSICDATLSKVLELYQVEKIVAVGRFCETRAKKTLKKYSPSRPIQILYLPHPSPRTVNNNNWDQKAVEYLKNLNLIDYYVKKS